VKQRAALIKVDSRIPGNAPIGNPLPFDVGTRKTTSEQREGVYTTHLAVVDREGNIVTWTTTIESIFGSGIMVPGYGFMLNNELTDFNLVPTFDPAATTPGPNPGANDVAPRKRPRSSMSPTMLFKDHKPFAAYGSPGGATIINTVFQITLNLIDHGMSIQQAINAPRISVTSRAGGVSCEQGPLAPRGFTPTPPFSPEVLQGLAALGDLVPKNAQGVPACPNTAIGSVQGIIVDLRTGERYGGADPRRDGTVISVDATRREHGDGRSDHDGRDDHGRDDRREDDRRDGDHR
jgi:gamma-glutamyltranspeptidase/glutathione hydrolase